MKGLAEYRQGNWESAAKWLQEAATRASDPALQLQAEVVLAMTQYQMKQTDAARIRLANAIAFDAKAVQRYGANWNDRRSAYVLLKEAKALIENASP